MLLATDARIPLRSVRPATAQVGLLAQLHCDYERVLRLRRIEGGSPATPASTPLIEHVSSGRVRGVGGVGGGVVCVCITLTIDH